LSLFSWRLLRAGAANVAKITERVCKEAGASLEEGPIKVKCGFDGADSFRGGLREQLREVA
jgi:hypothetical protein